jgi:hypothetical protein
MPESAQESKQSILPDIFAVLPDHVRISDNMDNSTQDDRSKREKEDRDK